MKKIILTILTCFLLGFGHPILSKEKIYVLDIKEEISPGMWHKTKKAFKEADSINADLIVLHINTYGGTVNDADSIRSKILDSTIPVYAFIDKNAASAGALISIACDSIYMALGSNIGAATVVNQTGAAMPDKYQSYMRSTMRSTAQAKGYIYIKDSNGNNIKKYRRDPLIAEAMVDQSLYIKELSDTGKVLTFTDQEAIKNGYCEGNVSSIDEVIQKASIESYTIHNFTPSSLDKLIGIMSSPYISGILLMFIIGGIYFELHSPGIGFPLLVSIVCSILYFFPLYAEGMAESWEIILFIIGILLILLEIFVVPGFGLTGISGIILTLGGLVLSLLNNDNLSFETVSSKNLSIAIQTVLLSILFSIGISFVVVVKMLGKKRFLFKKLSLQEVQRKEQGYIAVDMKRSSLIGKEGIAYTVLRPSGKILINNQIYDAISEQDFIDKGKKIKITSHESAQLYVREL